MLHNRSCCISWCIHVASCRKMHVNSVFLSRIIHSGCCRKSSVYQHFPYFRHSYQKCFAGSIPVSRLKKERYQIGIVLFFDPWQGSKVRCLRSAPVRAVRGPPDLVRRLALLLFAAGALILQGFRSFCVCMKL